MPPINIRSKFAQSHRSRLLYWAFVLNPVDIAARSFSVKPIRSNKKRVLFARLDGIGDYLIWTTAFEAINEIYPPDQYDRILVGNRVWKDLADKEMFSEILFVDTKRFVIDPKYRFEQMRTIHAFGADVAINPRLTREFLWNDSVIRVTGAAERIGTEGISNRLTPWQKKISDGWYTRLLSPPKDGIHEAISNIEFLKELSDREVNASIDSEKLFPSVTSSLGTVDGKYGILFLGAQIADKQWPIEKFASIAEFLSKDRDLQVVICGGPAEKESGIAFSEVFSGDVIDLIGKTSLIELGDLIRNAAIAVTNDTGAGHIAVAVDTPVVVVTPGNHIGRFFPYPETIGGHKIRQLSAMHQMPCFGCRWDCIYDVKKTNSPTPCVADVTVDKVIENIKKLIG